MRATNFQIRRLGLVLATHAGGRVAPAATINRFIERSHEDLLARQPNRLELQLWTTFLQHRGSRAQFEAALTSSAEYKADLVNGWYQRFLHRPATTGEISSSQFLLLHGTTDRQALALLLGLGRVLEQRRRGEPGFREPVVSEPAGPLADPRGIQPRCWGSWHRGPHARRWLSSC